MNVEALSTSKGKDFAMIFKFNKLFMMGIDESTTIKNSSAKRTKNILELSKLQSIEEL